MVPGAFFCFHSDSRGWGSASGYRASVLARAATAGSAALTVTTSTKAANASTLSDAEWWWSCEQQPNMVAGSVECVRMDATWRGITIESVGFGASTITAAGQLQIR